MTSELEKYKQALNEDANNYGKLIEEKRFEILYKTMNKKNGKALQTTNDKFIEPADDKYQLFTDVLEADNELFSLSLFLQNEEYDTDAIYHDLQENQQSNIYSYLEKNINDKINQFAVLKEVTKIYEPVIESNNFLDYTLQHKAFSLVQFCGFIGSNVDAGQTFLRVGNWDMATAVEKYFHFGGDITKMDQHNRKSTRLDGIDLNELGTEQADLYSLGTKYWYWSSMKNQPNYVESKYKNLKCDLFYHNNIYCNESNWTLLSEECQVKLNTKRVRKILSNGYNMNIYGIKGGIAFDDKHIRALLLYTNYTSWCSVFCTILRKQNKQEISGVAHWAKLLIECVQCYGSVISDNDVFYRGIDREFTFKKFVAAFNVPLSTTTELLKAAEFAGLENGSNGLVIELCNYDVINNVFTFDCAAMSAFSEESEMFFYGGDTILKIVSIRQLVNGNWTNYSNYVKATHAITRMMSGLSVKKNMNKSTRKAMKRIFNSMLHSSSKSLNLPIYIVERLLNYHIINRTAVVELDYEELLVKFEWMRGIFIKQDKKNILNICNICRIFHKSNNIVITMPDEQDANNLKITEEFYLSLEDDLMLLSHENLSMNKLSLSWPVTIPLEIKFRLVNLFANNKLWKAECSPSSVQITAKQAETDEVAAEQDTNNAIGLIEGLDADENAPRDESDAEDEVDETLMKFIWDIDETVLSDFKKDMKFEISEIKSDKHNGNKWIHILGADEDGINLELKLESLPDEIGAIKLNCIISCDELLYYKTYKDIILSLKNDAIREQFLKIDYDTSIVDTFDFKQFKNKELICLQFKFSIEILVRYDLYGGIFSEVDKPVYITPSELNHSLVFGYLDEIHNFDIDKITASPLSIYELIYKYYLMMIIIEENEGEFIWPFKDKREVKLFLNCRKGDVITSRKFEVCGCVFYLELTPNGWGNVTPLGKGALWVAVNSFPKNIIYIDVLYRVRCNEVEFRDEKTQRLCTDPSKGVYSFAPDGFMETAKFKELKKWEFKIFLKISAFLNERGEIVKKF